MRTNRQAQLNAAVKHLDRSAKEELEREKSSNHIMFFVMPAHEKYYANVKAELESEKVGFRERDYQVHRGRMRSIRVLLIPLLRLSGSTLREIAHRVGMV